MRILSFFVLFFLAIMTSPVRAEPNPNDLLIAMDHTLRSTSHQMTLQLDVRTSRWERQYKINVWMQGVDETFARVLAPAKVAGQGFLRKKARLWNYLPTAERTILIPPSMMLDRFMGSDFTNDDFVKLTYLPRDYDGQILGEEEIEGMPVYHLVLNPKPDAPVVYGKLEIWLRKSDSAPVKLKFFNEKMLHVRTLHYSKFKTFGSHETPTVWLMENIKDPGRQTTVTILDAVYGGEIDSSIFTRGHLES